LAWAYVMRAAEAFDSAGRRGAGWTRGLRTRTRVASTTAMGAKATTATTRATATARATGTATETKPKSAKLARIGARPSASC